MQAGATIDRFLVESTIGIGGMATVYRVRHRQLRTVHALKLLKISQPGMAERLLQEGRIQAGLKHPNVVAVADVVEHEGAIGLLMELVEGSSLEDCLQEGPMIFEEALEIFQQVLSGMAAAHDAGVTHRDLKPANILLANEGGRLVAKVTDFGIAKVLSSEEQPGATRTGLGMGTPGYMAPEQITDASSVDLRADIFALGAILYEMLCGRRAFKGTDQLDTLNRTVKGVYAPLSRVRPGIPPHIDQAVRRALSLRREDRFPDCRAMAAAISLPLAAVPELPPPTAAAPQEARPTAPPAPEAPEKPLLNLARLEERRAAMQTIQPSAPVIDEAVVPLPSVLAEAWGLREGPAEPTLSEEGGSLRALKPAPPPPPSVLERALESARGMLRGMGWFFWQTLRTAGLPLAIVLLLGGAWGRYTGQELNQVEQARQAQAYTLQRAVADSLGLVPGLVEAGANAALLRTIERKVEQSAEPEERAQAARELSTILTQELAKLPPARSPEEVEVRKRTEAAVQVLDREAERYSELARKRQKVADSVGGRLARLMRLGG